MQTKKVRAHSCGAGEFQTKTQQTLQFREAFGPGILAANIRFGLEPINHRLIHDHF